jgi:hypothetical protein
MPAPLADLAAEYLHVRSRLSEGAILAPKSTVSRLVAALGVPTAARSPAAAAHSPAPADHSPAAAERRPPATASPPAA